MTEPNKYRQLINFSLLYLGLFLQNALLAQDTLSLEQCINMAMERNYQVWKQKNTQEIYSINIKKAQDARLPNLYANISDNINWGRGIDPFTNTYANQQFSTYNAALGFDLNLFNGFYHINNIKLQKQSLEGNKSELQKLKNDITIDIVMRYTNILYLIEMKRNIQEQLNNSEKNIELTQKRIDAGNMAKREIYKAIAQRENESLSLLQAENTLETNKVELKQIVGLVMGKDIVLKELTLSALDYKDKTSFIDLSLNFSPSLKMQQVNLNKSKLGLDIAKSSFYPTLSLGGQLGSAYSTLNKFQSFNEQLDNNFSYGLRLNAQIPIFSQFQTRNKVKEAKLNIESVEIQLEIEKMNQYRILNKAFLDWKSSLKKWETSKYALTANQINYETEKIKYEAQRIHLQDLNLTKSNLLNSISSNVKDKYEMIFNSLVLKIYEGKF